MVDPAGLPAAFIGAGFFFMLGVFWLQRMYRTCFKPSSKKQRSYLPSIGALGLAMQNLQLFVHPSTEYVVEERLREATEEDDEGDIADPAKHLERQLRRIRRGERIDTLTAKLADRGKTHQPI